jgi:hypothetical protein
MQRPGVQEAIQSTSHRLEHGEQIVRAAARRLAHAEIARA